MATDKKYAKPRAARAATVTLEPSLSAIEERVLRAAHGSSIPNQFPLAQKDEGVSLEVKAKLRALEELAFTNAGRLAELLGELDVAEAELDHQEVTRTKIVSALKGSSSGE